MALTIATRPMLMRFPTSRLVAASLPTRSLLVVQIRESCPSCRAPDIADKHAKSQPTTAVKEELCWKDTTAHRTAKEELRRVAGLTVSKCSDTGNLCLNHCSILGAESICACVGDLHARGPGRHESLHLAQRIMPCETGKRFLRYFETVKVMHIQVRC